MSFQKVLSAIAAAFDKQCPDVQVVNFNSAMKAPTACTLLVLASLLCAQAAKDFPAGEPPSQRAATTAAAAVPAELRRPNLRPSPYGFM